MFFSWASKKASSNLKNVTVVLQHQAELQHYPLEKRYPPKYDDFEIISY